MARHNTRVRERKRRIPFLRFIILVLRSLGSKFRKFFQKIKQIEVDTQITAIPVIRVLIGAYQNPAVGLLEIGYKVHRLNCPVAVALVPGSPVKIGHHTCPVSAVYSHCHKTTKLFADPFGRFIQMIAVDKRVMFGEKQ